ncbi:triose-phosphate isomerase [Candidatus Paracaedibacter symbiosus]|uniref:triose-phosphate isomerase n=1 Tax=Candidatus Paracaedibacter symbiosus TaxID=244582 RepID=UPI00068A828D|nr:triose-phosphate isomerase [Candidatus Paracaedibacter symbiosus]
MASRFEVKPEINFLRYFSIYIVYIKHHNLNQLETLLGEEMSKLIVANWKMNGSLFFIESFFCNLTYADKNQVVFCPPFPYLTAVKSYLSKANYALGAQDCHAQDAGAFTGNTSAAMVRDVGGTYVILGHSERRQYHQETNGLVRQKSLNALKNDLIPIICVGETLTDRESKTHLDVVKQQLIESIPDTPESVVIAYEPVWAIGTGLSATLHDIVEMHQMIANYINNKYKILYGGSVTAENAKEILSQPHVDGVLVGGASLKSDLFSTIIAA